MFLVSFSCWWELTGTVTFNLTVSPLCLPVLLLCLIIGKNHLPFAVFTALFVTSFIWLRLWANKTEHSWPWILSLAPLLRQHFCAEVFSCLGSHWAHLESAPGPGLEPFLLVVLVKFRFHLWPDTRCVSDQGVQTLVFQMCLSLLYISISLHYFTAHLAHVIILIPVKPLP